MWSLIWEDPTSHWATKPLRHNYWPVLHNKHRLRRGLDVKRLPTRQETRVQFLGQEDLLEKEMATHSSILAWKIPRTDEPGRATVHGVAKSWTRLSNFTFLSFFTTREATAMRSPRTLLAAMRKKPSQWQRPSATKNKLNK